MADLKDFGVVKSWYEAYKKVNEEKKPEDEKKKSPVEVLPKEDNKEEEKKPEEKSEGGEVEKLKAEIERLKGEVQKKDLEVKKKDAETTVEPNAVTGEVPLRVGIAQSILDKKKKKEVKEESLESVEELEEGVLEKILKISQSNQPEDVKDAKGRVIKKLTPKGAQKFLKSLNDPLTGKSVFDRLPKSGGPTGRDDIGRITRGQPEQQLIDKLKSFKEELDEAKSLNDLKQILDRTTLLTPDEKKKIKDLEKSMGSKGYEKVLRKMFEETINEKVEYVEYKFRNKNDAMQAKRMIDGINTMDLDVNDDAIGIGELTVDAGKKDFTRFHNMIMQKYRPKILTQESLDEARDLNAIEYARRLAGYAVKFGGIDKRDFMKIADKLSNAKNDNDLKTIGKQVDSLDTEPRDLIKGSVALLMGPKSYQKMFGDRLTARDMNVYKDMTPYSLREETLNEGDAYDNDRFLVRGNTATVDNKNTPDTRNHVYAPNAKTAVAMFKKGVKQYLDTPAMRRQFPTYKESLDEVNVDSKGTITTDQLKRLKSAYNSLPDRIKPEHGVELAKKLSQFGEGELRQLVHADIKFMSTLAVNQLIMKHKYTAKDIHDIRKSKPKTVFD